ARAGTISLVSDRPVQSAAELFRVLFSGLPPASGAVDGQWLMVDGSERSEPALVETLNSQLSTLNPQPTISVMGKAAPFAAELARWPRAMALPEQGSKYSPMIDHLLVGLKERGVLERVDHLVLRIGLNELDGLGSAGDVPLRLPQFLRGVLGS